MKISIALALSSILAATILSGCASTPSATATKAEMNFGCAIQVGDIYGDENQKFLSSNFNCIVPENTLKWGNIHPTKTFWNWGDMDAMMDFCEANGMKVRGHTFLWHQQNAPYVTGVKGEDNIRKIIVDQVTTIMDHYKGRIYEYDVANEIFEEDGTFRKTFWYNNLGEEAYYLAFKTAREADPDARLFLNDYNNECAGTPKSDAQYEFIKKMKEEGIPIDGVGFQLHLQEDLYFNKEAILENIRRYAAIGIDVSFTEVDVRIKTPGTDDSRKHQEEIYAELMDMALKEPNVHSFLVWGTTDDKSWVPASFPSYGEALPFEKGHKAKPLFNTLVKKMEDN